MTTEQQITPGAIARIAAEHGIGAWADRLRGNTEDELHNDAAALAADLHRLRGDAQPQDPPSFDGS